jgi:large subunit ribosomal protein L3
MMIKGLLGKKLGMTTVFDETGNQRQCTVIHVEPNIVTQVRTEERDGYAAIQLAFGEKKVKRTSKAMAGHFEAAGTTPKAKVREFAPTGDDVDLGVAIVASDLFEEGEIIDVAGVSKGKGFQGVVKRHGFHGVGGRTHGQHNRERAPGSIGASSTPSRVYKGMRMAGRTGGRRITVKNLKVVRILEDHNVVLIEGAVPGARNSLVELLKRK